MNSKIHRVEQEMEMSNRIVSVSACLCPLPPFVELVAPTCLGMRRFLLLAVPGVAFTHFF